MATPSLRYVVPSGGDPVLQPEPVIIYDLPGGGGDDVTWDTISGKPEVIAEGDTAEEARTAIGAGTSSVVVGTGAANAAAGNHTHTFASLAGSVSDAEGATLQAILEDIAGRLAALEA